MQGRVFDVDTRLLASLNLPGTAQFHHVAETESGILFFVLGGGGCGGRVDRTMKLSPQLVV